MRKILIMALDIAVGIILATVACLALVVGIVVGLVRTFRAVVREANRGFREGYREGKEAREQEGQIKQRKQGQSVGGVKEEEGKATTSVPMPKDIKSEGVFVDRSRFYH